MDGGDLPTISMISVDQIHVLNPRVRNQRIFKEIVTSISNLGLKRPITVSRASNGANGLPYNLVCGQGRLEAYLALGQSEIPAVVIDVPERECLVMSLIENLARRHHRPLELIRSIEALKANGYSDSEISGKTDLSFEYVRGIGRLLQKGEERLINAVEMDQIPLTVAIRIANSDDEGIQLALAEAYETNALRGKKLMAAKRLVEQRRRKGKKLHPSTGTKKAAPISSNALVKAYRQEVERQQLMIRKAEIAQRRLIFVVEALKTLLKDENFVTLLRAESLDSVPQRLVDLMETRETG